MISYEAKSQEPCGTDALLRLSTPISSLPSEVAYQNYLQQPPAGLVERHIPVVFHIIYNNAVDNIGDAQVFNALEELNMQFAGAEGGFDTNIRFHLANVDPDGNCTTGINRVQSTLCGNVDDDGSGDADYSADIALKDLIRWPIANYVNIWIVPCITHTGPNIGLGNIVGYATLPQPFIYGGFFDSIDGIVISNPNLGNTGTAANNIVNTLSHEMGHYFNLLHVWGTFTGPTSDDANCGLIQPNCIFFGDNVCDTPPCSGAVGQLGGLTCPPPFASGCSNSPLPYPAENYMSFYHQCQDRFTEGQATRMHYSMTSQESVRNLLWPDFNLFRTGIACDIDDDDITISTSTIWNAANGNGPNGEHYIFGNVTVQANRTLTIAPGTKVFFCPNRSLTIESTGQVFHSGSLNAYGEGPVANCMWQGVTVNGNPNAGQAVNEQGRFRGYAGSEIANAVIGVATGNSNSNTGGIVYLTGTTLRNNKWGVTFSNYINPSGVGNVSRLINCAFLHQPNAPVFLRSFVEMIGTNGVQIWGSSFINQLPKPNGAVAEQGTGIRASDAGFRVLVGPQNTQNYFEGLGYGIESRAVSANRSFIAQRSDFRNCYIGIYNSGVNNVNIAYNNFLMGTVPINGIFGYSNTGPTINASQVGVFFDQAMSGMTFQENNFTREPNGITNLFCIGTISKGLGSANNLIRHNTYNDMHIGNLADGINANNNNNMINGLHYLCNINTNSRRADFATPNATPQEPVRLRKIQGQTQTAPLPTLWSGNTFSFTGTGGAAWQPERDVRYHGSSWQGSGTLNYFFQQGSVPQTPVNFGGIIPIFGSPNACAVEVNFTDPGDGGASALKAAWYGEELTKEALTTEYETALVAEDSSLADQKAVEITHVSTEMDEKAMTIIRHEMGNADDYNTDSVAVWVMRLHTPQNDMGAAMLQAQSGNIAAAQGIIDGIQGRFGEQLSDTDRQDLQEIPDLINMLRDNAVHTLPDTDVETLRRFAKRDMGYVPAAARAILVRYGDTFTPTFRLPEDIAHEFGLPVLNHVGFELPKMRANPNPANETVTFDWNDTQTAETTATLTISDVLGRAIATYTLQNGTAANIAVKSYPEGLYFFQLANDVQILQSGKFFVQH